MLPFLQHPVDAAAVKAASALRGARVTHRHDANNTRRAAEIIVL